MATVPTAPNIVSLPRAQDGSIEFWWNPPTSDGGSAITGYTVSCSSPQTQVVLPATAYNTWVKGLTNGQNYTFFITASNAVGESQPATWQPYQPGFIPSPPTGVGAFQQGTSSNLEVSRSTPTTSTNTVNYWSVQATPADTGFSTIVQAEYGSNLTTVIPGLNMNGTQWQVTARQLTDPGWSDPSAKTAYVGNNRVRSAFVTNTAFSRVIYSQQGDMFMVGTITNSNISTILYNSRGNEVQRIPPQPVNSSYIMYSSADGVTNTWLSLINGSVILTATDTNPGGQLDSNGNLTFIINIGSALYHRFLDKNGTTILSNSTPNTQTVPYVLKMSSNGIYTGSNDSNTWAASISTPNTLNVGATNLGSDTNGSIFLGFQIVNNTGGATTKTTTFLDRLGNPIGNTVSIPFASGATNSTQYFFAKYDTNGLASNSWNAFWSNNVPAALIYNYCAKVNSANELVASFRFRGGNSYIYDANRSTIGGVLPYLSTPGFANLDTCLVKFGTTGTSNDSWRAVIHSESQNTSAYKDDVPLSTTIDSSNNIIVTGFSELFTTGTNLIPFDKNDTSNVSVTQSTFSAFNMFVTRYTNTGTPEWITTLGGASTIGTPSTIIGLASGNSGSAGQLITTAMDSKNNMYIVGNYNSNSLVLRNKNGIQQGFISSPRSNTDIFIAKVSADGASGALARLGSVSTVNSFANTNWRVVIDPNDTIYLAGTYAANLFGFYPSSNSLTPSMFISSYTAGANYQNTYVAKIDSGLSTISLGRYQTSNATTGICTQSPRYLSYDSFYNPILAHQTQIPTDTVGVFTMGNHTNTPDYIVNNSNSAGQLYRFTTTATTRFTTNSTTSWTALQIAGNITVQGGSSNLLATVSLISPAYGSIFVDSNDRIYTSIFTSSATSSIIFDGTASTIIVPQQIVGNSINASTITMMLSYPIDGINRPQ
jgi:hypothetical protein